MGGRVKRDTQLDEAIAAAYPNGPTTAQLIDAGYLSPIPRYRRTEAEPVPATPGERIAELEKQLDDATTKLCAAQMLLEQADGRVQKLETKLTEALGVRKVRVPVKMLSVLANSSAGTVVHFADQKLTIESV